MSSVAEKNASSKEHQCVIIGTTHLYTKFDIFWTKYCCPYYNSLVECVQIRTTFLFNFCVMMPVASAFAQHSAYFQYKFRILVLGR